MYANTLEVMLTPRTDSDVYNVQMNQTVVDILSLIFEFKVATSWHVTRFLRQKDHASYIYLKLRRMWQAQLLESFKVYSGSRSGMLVYYMLSKKGLRVLKEQGTYGQRYLKNYPQPKAMLSWASFKHEAQVVELASMEVKNKSKNLNITFKGEASSGSYDFMSDKNIEVFTPDYTVFYCMGERQYCVFSEFERTPKSREVMTRKLDRYVRYLSVEQREHSILRFIFQTSGMEQAFWLNLMTHNAGFLQKVNIVTTNLLLLKGYEQFLEPIYTSETTIQLTKQGRLGVDTEKHIKLFPFL
jgi:hypothetical protein